LLEHELNSENITRYRLWDGIVCPGKVQTGIAKAHKQIVRYAKEKNLPEILIGEDDLHFCAPGAFNYFLSQKPTDYDLYLGGLSNGKLSKDKLVDDFAGLLLYMVHERFYETFLAIVEDKHLDRSLKFKGKYVVCDPQPVIEHSGYSDNMKEYVDASIFFSGRNLFNG